MIEYIPVAFGTDDTMAVDFGETYAFPKSSTWLTEVSLLASAWEGSEKLWSQIVAIDGSTECSKVDLTPSAEQLAIFHEKDIAFTTENNDGIITVFAIGDKPSNDYTIPAVVTEVSI